MSRKPDPSKPLVSLEIEDYIITKVPLDIVQKYTAMPLYQDKDGLLLAVTDPSDIALKDALKNDLKIPIQLYEARILDIQNLIAYYYGKQKFSDILSSIQNKEIVNYVKPLNSNFHDRVTVGPDMPPTMLGLLSHVFYRAILQNASDIHIETGSEEGLIRFRIDGVLSVFEKIPATLYGSFISIIKIQSSLDITKKRVPQEGKLEISLDALVIDARVSIIPTVYGEKVSVRLLKKDELHLGLEELGFSKKQASLVDKLIHTPSGLGLVVGPTGAGKTTTLFSILSILKTVQRHIITIEDPVEYQLNLVSQVEVNEDLGLDFNQAVRRLLRHDPDVIMLGEIRDSESAKLAIQSALAGTMVLSTLHSSNALMVVDRLLNMGADKQWISSVINYSIAQRLLRRICSHCKKKYTPPESLLTPLGLPLNHNYVHGTGCRACRGTGYVGRVCIAEICVFSESMKQAIFEGKSSIHLRKIAIKEGFKSFSELAKEKVSQGISTVEEIYRVLSRNIW